MKKEIELLINSGIELIGKGVFTINAEIETRLNTSRKLNRSIDSAGGTSNYWGEIFELPINILLSMKAENDSVLQKLYDLKRTNSPFKEVKPVVLDKFDTGAIICDSWGCNQTNIDYYCIVKRAGQYVTVLPMKTATSAEIGFMTNKETPLEIDFTQDPIRKKVKSFHGKESGFSMRYYATGGWVSLYDGEPKTSTHYA